MKRFVIFLAGLWMLCGPALAQDDPVEARPVELGTRFTGTFDDRNPRAVYALDGSRGEVVRLELVATSGNLDPIVAVFNAQGQPVVRRDDALGERHVRMTLTLTEDGRYYIVAGRFGYNQGLTRGEYELRIERLGVVSRQGSTLRYNIPVADTISSTQPYVYYTFRAEAGDIVNIDMVRSSGTLDPYLQVADSDRFIIASNDDIDATTRNARIANLLIDKAGTYIVIATRYGEEAGDTVGSFVLTLTQADNSGLGNSSLAPAIIVYNQTVEGVLTNDQFERYYRFTGNVDDIVTLTLNQTGGRLDPYLRLANAGLQVLVEDDDGGGGQNSRIERYRLPASGTYYIIVTRFDGERGTTTGNYRLQLQQVGNAYDGVAPEIPRLLYGTTVQDFISDEDPDSIFAFWGDAGDIISILMNRAGGDLDPVLELLNAQQERLVRDDDSGGGQNARIERYTLPYTGIYFIRAARYSGNLGASNTTGPYNLVFVQVVD